MPEAKGIESGVISNPSAERKPAIRQQTQTRKVQDPPKEENAAVPEVSEDGRRAAAAAPNTQIQDSSEEPGPAVTAPGPKQAEQVAAEEINQPLKRGALDGGALDETPKTDDSPKVADKTSSPTRRVGATSPFKDDDELKATLDRAVTNIGLRPKEGLDASANQKPAKVAALIPKDTTSLAT